MSAFIFSLVCSPYANAGNLKAKINSIIKDKRLMVGISALCGNKKFALNGDKMFPLMSVFKTHVALTVLDKLERNKISIDTILHISREQIHENTYSPMRDAYPTGDTHLSVRKLIEYSVAESDNNACDILIDFVGGTKMVDRYIKSLGIKDFDITQTEDDMHRDLARVYLNRSTPKSMTSLLKVIVKQKGTPQNINILLKAMSMASTGSNKIMAALPMGATLHHKTGSSDRINGVKTADNDAGIISMPDRNDKLFITVFIMESLESDDTNAKVIAEIARVVIEEFE